MERLQGSTLHRVNTVTGEEVDIGFKFESTNFTNILYIVTDDEYEYPVGVLFNPGDMDAMSYLLGDQVEIAGDCYGYVAPGISMPGVGRITEIQRDDTDHFFGIQMENGEFGFVKCARIRRIVS